MNFNYTWQQLDEIYTADYNKTGTKEVIAQAHGLSTGLLYHFYEDLPDLLNSLETGVIYSTKNDKEENKAQFDYSDGVGDGTSYVCMTHTLAGKNAAIKSLGRPFGLSFKAKELAQRCKETGSTIKSFDAWGAKGNYDLSSRNSPYLLAQTEEQGFNPFNVLAVGKLPSITTEQGESLERFFISGGQSTQGLWNSKIFHDAEVYAELRKWFVQSYTTGEAYQKRMFYHFVNGKVGDTLRTHNGTESGKPIMVSGNKNTEYKPFPFKGKDGGISYTSAMAFEFTGEHSADFEEVVGYGPFNVKDDNGKHLLGLSTVNANSQGNYRGPFIFGKNVSDGTFSATTQYRKGQSRNNTMPDGTNAKSIQQHLMAGEKLFKKLSAIYDEHEYRIYLPSSQDFRFEASDIETIVLPEVFRLPGTKESINLVLLVDCIMSGAIDLTEPSALKALGIIKTSTKKALPSTYVLDLTTSMIELLEATYQHIKVEFIPNTHDDSTAAKVQATLGSLQKTGEATDGVPLNKDGSVPNKDHARKVIHTWPDFSTIEIKTGQNAEQTVTADIAIPGLPEAQEARIGSEVILIAEDEQHNKYVLFVYKSKSPMFMELPGGGFSAAPNSEADFTKLLLDKLAFKCNINAADLTSVKDTGKALVLYEKGVALDSDVSWPWSYYRLFTAKLNQPLSGKHLADLGYSFDNSELAKALSDPAAGITVHNYRAHMRWVPVKHITLNRAITDRYSNIIPLIQEVASKV